MNTDIGYRTDKGKVRQRNEDSLCVARIAVNGIGDDCLVLAVADGMGGHLAGNVASRFVTNEIGKMHLDARPGHGNGYISELLREKLAEINVRLGALAQQNPDYTGMGTTLTAGLFVEKKLFIVHVGDSRCYLLRDGFLQRLTEDHSWVAEQVTAGCMTEDEAFSHKYRNILTQCLNGGAVDPFLVSHTLERDDVILFSSDGLHGALTDGEIAGILKSGVPSRQICDSLIEAALHRGGHR